MIDRQVASEIHTESARINIRVARVVIGAAISVLACGLRPASSSSRLRYSRTYRSSRQLPVIS